MEKSLTLSCGECGHIEQGGENRMLMLKVRMLNHVTREHPELVERFKDVVDARPPGQGEKESVR